MEPQQSVKRIFKTTALFFIVLAGALLFFYIKGLPLTAKVDLEAAPNGTQLTIDGHKARQGINRVRPGTHKVTAAHDGFATDTVNVALAKGDKKFVGFALLSNSSSTANWYDEHLDDKQKSQDISSKNSDANSKQAIQNVPLIKRLPFIDERSNFRIDYGVSIAHPGDPSAVAIYITTDGSSASKEAALAWIRFSGYDPAKLELIYKQFDQSTPSSTANNYGGGN